MASTMRAGTSVNQITAALFGAVYIAVGIIGFLVDSTGFAETSGDEIFGIFEVNPLHNIAHLAIGAALLLFSRRLDWARAVNTTVGAAYLLLGVLGPLLIDTEYNILALNVADNWLHIVSATVLLAVGLFADRGAMGDDNVRARRSTTSSTSSRRSSAGS